MVEASLMRPQKPLNTRKRPIDFEQNFLIDKCSSTIVSTIESDIFKVLAVSRKCNLQSIVASAVVVKVAEDILYINQKMKF